MKRPDWAVYLLLVGLLLGSPRNAAAQQSEDATADEKAAVLSEAGDKDASKSKPETSEPSKKPETPAPQATKSGPDEETQQRLEALEKRLKELEAAQARPVRPKIEVLDKEDRITLENVRKYVLNNVRLYGGATASYVCNWNKPPTRKEANAQRVSDADHNNFGVNQVYLGLSKDLEGELDVGFSFDVHAGNSVDNIFSFDREFLPDEEINIGRAFLSMRIEKFGIPIEIRFGQDYGWFTVESNDLYKNPLFSLSYFASFTPYLNTGVFASFELTDEITYMQYVGNGSEVIVDNNNAKTVGGQLAYATKDERLFIALNWLFGAERDDNVADKRLQLEIDAIYKAESDTIISLMLMYGNEENADVRNGGQAHFGGASLIVRQEFNIRALKAFKKQEKYNPVAVIVRGTVFRDAGGANSGRHQTLTEFTAALEYRPLPNAWIRLEYRHDRSSEAGEFPGTRSANARRTQDSIAIAMSMEF